MVTAHYRNGEKYMTERSSGHSERTSVVGAAVVEDRTAPFGRQWWNWPLVRLNLDEEGGRLKGNDEIVPSFLLKLVTTPPDVRFFWEEVREIELTRRKTSRLGSRALAFKLMPPARDRSSGAGGFEFMALSERVEAQVIELAQTKGVEVKRSS